MLLCVDASDGGNASGRGLLYIASAGKDAKVYIWNMGAVLKQQDVDYVDLVVIQRADDAKPGAKLEASHTCFPSALSLTSLLGTCSSTERSLLIRLVRFVQYFLMPVVSKQQPNNRGLARYGDDFWGINTNYTPRHTAPPASPSTPLHWRSLLGSLRFTTPFANASQSTLPRESRRWNFSSFLVGPSRRTVDVAPARDEDRYDIAPPTEAEVAAAMQRTSGNETDGSTQQGHPAPGTQWPQARTTETQVVGVPDRGPVIDPMLDIQYIFG
ncbi:hypothetical protein F4604DRAFT_1680312 [Suillus subluteus]|nr:hypothetical protein F4604DRAFT_1680312 [Suillus subluteus]